MRSFTSTLFMSLLAPATLATVIHVPAHQPNLQAGIDVASNGDTVHISAGTYSGTGFQLVSTSGKELLILGDGIAATTIDGAGSAYGISLTSTPVEIRGITMTNFVEAIKSSSAAKSTATSESISIHRIVECEITGNQYGVNWVASSLVIDSSRIATNSSFGIFLDDGLVTITDCIVDSNAVGYGSTSRVWVDRFDVVFTGCSFVGNTIVTSGSATFDNCSMTENEDVVRVEYRELELRKCLIQSNSGFVGAIGNLNPESMAYVLFDSCHIKDNQNGISNQGGLKNGAIVEIVHCLYSGNSGPIHLGYRAGAKSFVSNSTVVNNFSDGVIVDTNNVGLQHLVQTSIIAGNTGSGINYSPTSTTSDIAEVSCNDVIGNVVSNYIGCPDQTGTNSNISDDPQFCDSVGGDFRVSESSVCAAANNSCGVLMGAFEASCFVECCVGIRGDINYDNSIDITDLTYFVDYMFAGGDAPPCMSEADLNGDDSVDITDLTYLVEYLFGGGPPPFDCLPDA